MVVVASCTRWLFTACKFIEDVFISSNFHERNNLSNLLRVIFQFEDHGWNNTVNWFQGNCCVLINEIHRKKMKSQKKKPLDDELKHCKEVEKSFCVIYFGCTLSTIFVHSWKLMRVLRSSGFWVDAIIQP